MKNKIQITIEKSDDKYVVRATRLKGAHVILEYCSTMLKAYEQAKLVQSVLITLSEQDSCITGRNLSPKQLKEYSLKEFS